MTHLALEPSIAAAPHPGSVTRETILAAVEQMAHLAELRDVSQAIARGFADIGAAMTVLLVRRGDDLTVVARRTNTMVDTLVRQATGKEWSQNAISLSDRGNPVVAVFRSLEPMRLQGAEAVVDHIMATYQLDDTLRRSMVRCVNSETGVVLPLVVNGEALGVAQVTFSGEISEADLHWVTIFAASGARMLHSKDDTVQRAAIVADLGRAIETESRTQVELSRTERLAALGEMSAVVAHEIRNPLAVIRNSLSSLKRHMTDCEETRLLDGIIDEETQRIERVVDDMLAFSSPLEIRARPVDARELIQKAILLAAKEAPRVEDTQVTCGGSQDLLYVVSDPLGLTRALVSLLINAGQATEQGGNVWVSARRVEAEDRLWVRITVRDTGVGIAPEHLERLFEPFFTTKAAGVGLGLVAVKRLIDALGGRLAVDSKLGQGTTVTVDLRPADRDHQS